MTAEKENKLWFNKLKEYLIHELIIKIDSGELVADSKIYRGPVSDLERISNHKKAKNIVTFGRNM